MFEEPTDRDYTTQIPVQHSPYEIFDHITIDELGLPPYPIYPKRPRRWHRFLMWVRDQLKPKSSLLIYGCPYCGVYHTQDEIVDHIMTCNSK